MMCNEGMFRGCMASVSSKPACLPPSLLACLSFTHTVIFYPKGRQQGSSHFVLLLAFLCAGCVMPTTTSVQQLQVLWPSHASC
jgi:hypothetical protein